MFDRVKKQRSEIRCFEKAPPTLLRQQASKSVKPIKPLMEKVDYLLEHLGEGPLPNEDSVKRAISALEATVAEGIVKDFVRGVRAGTSTTRRKYLVIKLACELYFPSDTVDSRSKDLQNPDEKVHFLRRVLKDEKIFNENDMLFIG